MGTRRSKHNKGRKPFYKDHRSVAMHLLEHPRCDFGLSMGASWAWTRTTWSETEMFKLSILCEADADLEGSADCLGRSPTSIAHRAKDFGLCPRGPWLKLITPKRKYKPVDRHRLMSYPYIANARDEHATLLAINSIIPATIPENMRADMCQEIMLAIFEGSTTLEQLQAKKASGTYFIKKFYHDNYEAGGHAISFNDVDDGWNADSVYSSLAAKEWHREQFTERTSHVSAFKTFTPPEQFEAAWRDQIGRVQLKHHELGEFLTEEEVEEMLEAENA